MLYRSRLVRATLVAGAVLVIPACGGGHKSQATRQADFANVENIISATSRECRTNLGALADAVRAALPKSASRGALDQAARAAVTACAAATDEEIQDLATLSVPSDLGGLRLDQVSSDLTAWAADGVSVATGLVGLAPNRTVAAALAELNAKTSDMQRLAQSVQATLAAAAAALKTPVSPLDMPSIGQPPG